MNSDRMDQYVRATKIARGIRHFCRSHGNSKFNHMMYDTVLSYEDNWEFYRSLEYFVETANEVIEQSGAHSAAYFMLLIRTLHIINIGDWNPDNAEGLPEFFRKHHRYHEVSTDNLNAASRLLSKSIMRDSDLEPDILMLCLSA